ncbi:HD domain-containing protein [Roseiflexus sp.]|uniref:HD domain-containing protein n=1 Tax=Roseiflexus sp. TaxID=2562120 RepID=UPI00398B3939
MTYTDRALAILHEWVQGEQLRKHCYAVAASMRHFAPMNGGDPDLWGAIGLLHDMDFELYPHMPPPGDSTTAASEAILAGQVTEAPLQMHPFVGVTYLRLNGWSPDVCRAILSHANYSGVPRETVLEKTLAAVDELSSFVVAVALVRPTKSVFEVDVTAVRKKMKDKAFARAVSRDEIITTPQRLTCRSMRSSGMSSRGCAPMRSAWGLRATQGDDAATPPIESIDAHDVGGSAATPLCRLLPPIPDHEPLSWVIYERLASESALLAPIRKTAPSIRAARYSGCGFSVSCIIRIGFYSGQA